MRVSTRIFLSHEWARTEGRASQFSLMPCGVELFHADGADPQHLDMLQIVLTYPVVVGPPTGTDRETQPLSLIRRFTAFTSGYASVPSYGGNAHITHKCYIPFFVCHKAMGTVR